MPKETINTKRLVALSPSPRNLPEGFRPPEPAWASCFADQQSPIVMAYFGTQFHDGFHGRLVPPVQAFFESVDAPANFENARYADRLGCTNLITAAYWTDPASYSRWENDSGFEAWWKDPERLKERRGHFREVLSVPTNRFETIFSHGILVGVAKTGSEVVGPIREHGYWGSMRDRIRVSLKDDLTSIYNDELPRLGAKETRGRRLTIKTPENLAVIRSGQSIKRSIVEWRIETGFDSASTCGARKEKLAA